MKRLRCGTTMAWLMSGILLGCAGRGKPPETFAKLPSDFWLPLTMAFEKQARGLDDQQWKALYAKHMATTETPVNVAVIDVVPGNTATQVQSVHPFAITRVIRSLFCETPNTENCRIQTNTIDATTHAGASVVGQAEAEPPYFLTFEQLAGALRNVLDRSKPNEHLIINLGVAWDPVKTDPGAANVEPILQQLRRASCLGAIVIAPAGNFTGSTGAMFPAVLEAEAAPTAESCAQVGFPRAQTISDGYAPLVYAVGALDARDRRLEAMRYWGQPRLAAYGLAVSAPGSQEMPYTLPLTGTSMSTAIVSGVAASVWSARPKLNGHQMMDLVYQGGIELDGGSESGTARTDFCVGQPFGPCREWGVRRAFLCGALAKALPDEKLSCASTPSTSANLSDKPPFTPPEKPLGPFERCRTTGCGFANGPAAIQRVEGAVPQPNDPLCPTCTLTTNSMWGALVWPNGAPSTMFSVNVQTFASVFSHTPTAEFPIPAWAPTDANFFFWMGPPAGTKAAVMNVTDANGPHQVSLIVPRP